MADLPATLYVQDSADKRVGLVVNHTPEGTLQQRIKDPGKVVGVYELKRLVAVAVTVPAPELTMSDILPPAEAAQPAVVDTAIAANQT